MHGVTEAILHSVPLHAVSPRAGSWGAVCLGMRPDNDRVPGIGHGFLISAKHDVTR